jgi:hypothetical protein
MLLAGMAHVTATGFDLSLVEAEPDVQSNSACVSADAACDRRWDDRVNCP